MKEASPAQKKYILLIPLIYNSQKHKLTFSGTRQISNYLKMEEGQITKGYKRTLGGSRYSHYYNCHDGLTGRHMSKLKLLQFKYIQLIECQLITQKS